MKSGLTVLFTSAGRRVELLKCFRESAQKVGRPVRLLAADAKPELSAACRTADAWERVPLCSSADYVTVVLELCRREKVDILVPTIDPELELISRHARDFALGGTRVVVSSSEAVAIARDKQATAKWLFAAGINVPLTLSLADYRLRPEALSGDLIAKPINGSSSIGLVRGRSAGDFAALPSAEYLVQEFWLGREYTVNLFFDQTGVLRCAIPHWRIETRGGEVSKGRIERVPQLEEAACRIAKALPGARGPICFQAIVDASRNYAVFEINARFGGGYPLAHRAGAYFSQWLLEEALGIPCSANNNWKDNVTMLRYDSAIFTDG